MVQEHSVDVAAVPGDGPVRGRVSGQWLRRAGDRQEDGGGGPSHGRGPEGRYLSNYISINCSALWKLDRNCTKNLIRIS